jgi:hypothetical protein
MINSFKELLHVITVGIVDTPAAEPKVADPAQHLVCSYRFCPNLDRNGAHAVTIGFDARDGGFEISFDADTLHADNLAWALNSAVHIAKQKKCGIQISPEVVDRWEELVAAEIDLTGEDL